MKRVFVHSRFGRIALCSIPYLLFFLFLALTSFSISNRVNDFLKQLGITKETADERIDGSLLAGGLNFYGLQNARNIALGNRKAVMMEILSYTKQRVNSAEFKKQYLVLKETNKPQAPNHVQTPEELKQQQISTYKKAVEDVEAMVKNADASNKATFQKMLEDARKELKSVEDPNNKMYQRYARNYEQMVKDIQAGYEYQLAQWEEKYPANHQLYVKKRLLQFMETTEGIDFSAELTNRNGKKVFVNPDYERKGSWWKMAFRAGKEVVEPARAFVQQWINEIQ